MQMLRSVGPPCTGLFELETLLLTFLLPSSFPSIALLWACYLGIFSRHDLIAWPWPHRHTPQHLLHVNTESWGLWTDELSTRYACQLCGARVPVPSVLPCWVKLLSVCLCTLPLSSLLSSSLSAVSLFCPCFLALSE